MSEKELFFKSVDKICRTESLCGVAAAVKYLYEATVDPNPNDPNSTTFNQVDLSKFSEDELGELQGDITKISEAKKQSDEANSELAATTKEASAKANAIAAQKKQQEEQNAQQNAQ